MAKLKNRKVDLIGKYNIAIELSMIASLVIVISAFKFFPHIESQGKVFNVAQELFKVEDISASVQDKPILPPPARPQIIVATPSDEILKDVDISSNELDINQEVAPPPKEMTGNRNGDVEPQFFVVVEEMPEPIGGIEAIQKNIKYPEIARRAGIEGTVFVLAYLDERGNVVKTEITKGLPGGLNEAAMDAVKLTKFIPGKQRGKAVKVKVVIPIKFVLEAARPG